ncbi:MAG TPA: hypothetical protein VIO38_09005, partial [Rariglobus sp.]
IAGTDATLTLTPGAGHALTQQAGASIIAGTLDLRGAGSSHALTAGSNQVSYLTADTGSLSFAGEGGFAIGLSSDTDANGITATGPVSLAAVGANATLYLNSFIRLTPGDDTTLDLSATRDLIVNQGSTIEILGSHKADVTLTSNSLGDADGGSVYLLQGSTLTTNNGALTVGGGQDGGFALARPGDNELPYGIWVATSTINTGAGDMTFRGIGENGVRFNGSSLTTTSGDILVEGRGAATGGTGVFIKSYVNAVDTPTTPVEFLTGSGNIHHHQGHRQPHRHRLRPGRVGRRQPLDRRARPAQPRGPQGSVDPEHLGRPLHRLHRHRLRETRLRRTRDRRHRRPHAHRRRRR